MTFSLEEPGSSPKPQAIALSFSSAFSVPALPDRIYRAKRTWPLLDPGLNTQNL